MITNSCGTCGAILPPPHVATERHVCATPGPDAGDPKDSLAETTVANIKAGETYDVYAGRAGHGHEGWLGNPEESLEAFERYFMERVERDRGFRAKVLACHGKVLGCFCVSWYPAFDRTKGLPPSYDRCHAVIVARWINAHAAEAGLIQVVGKFAAEVRKNLAAGVRYVDPDTMTMLETEVAVLTCMRDKGRVGQVEPFRGFPPGFNPNLYQPTPGAKAGDTRSDS